MRRVTLKCKVVQKGKASKKGKASNASKISGGGSRSSKTPPKKIEKVGRSRAGSAKPTSKPTSSKPAKKATSTSKPAKKAASVPRKPAPAIPARKATPSEREAAGTLARALNRVQKLGAELVAAQRSIKAQGKASTRAEKAKLTRATREAVKVGKAQERARVKARAAAAALAKKKAAADLRAANRAAAARAAQAAKDARAAARQAKIDAKEAARAARKAAKAPHPVEGCGKPYKAFRVGDKQLFAETATALNAQRAARGQFGKATDRQVKASIGKLKREAYARYQELCEQELAAPSAPLGRVDPRDFLDEVPF